MGGHPKMREPVTNEDLRDLAGYFRVAFWLRVLEPVFVVAGAATTWLAGKHAGAPAAAAAAGGTWLAFSALLLADDLLLRRLRNNPALRVFAATGGARRPWPLAVKVVAWIVACAAAVALPPVGIPAVLAVLGDHEMQGLRRAHGTSAALGRSRDASRAADAVLVVWAVSMLCMVCGVGVGVVSFRSYAVMLVVAGVAFAAALPVWVRALRCYARTVQALETSTAEEVQVGSTAGP